MCVVKKPKVKAESTQPTQNKPPVYLTNPFLDDPGNRAIAFGRNALRIDPRGSTVSAPIRIDPINTAPWLPQVNPGLGIGGGVVVGGGVVGGGGGGGGGKGGGGGGGKGGGAGYVREDRDLFLQMM